MADERFHKILVMFGSKTDEHVYDEILHEFAHRGIEYELKIASAHKSPDLVDEAIAKADYDVVIAGAGLAAHLPGVVAVKTIKPVIGVPVDGSYQGLDAMLSIMQMPPGIPVMGVGVNNARTAALNAIKMLRQLEYVNIIGDSEVKAVHRCRDMMEQFDNEFKVSDAIDNDAVNIKFVELGDELKEDEALVIYCPLHDESTADAALNLLKMASHGLWVGLNRGDNAALAALQIINLDGRHDETFRHHRESLRKSIAEANKK